LAGFRIYTILVLIDLIAFRLTVNKHRLIPNGFFQVISVINIL